MDDLSPEVIATVAAERFGDAYGGVINATMRQHLGRLIEAAIRDGSRGQRQACAQLCQARAALWEGTERKPGTTEPLRAEARARANEAAYLADAMQSPE